MTRPGGGGDAYTHVAVAPPGTRLLYLAGQIGQRPDGSLPPTFEEQLVQAHENVRAILASQNAGPEHVVKVTIYAAARPTDMARIRAHRREFYRGTAYPPSTWVTVSGLARADYLVEIEVIAAVPDGAARDAAATRPRAAATPPVQ